MASEIETLQAEIEKERAATEQKHLKLVKLQQAEIDKVVSVFIADVKKKGLSAVEVKKAISKALTPQKPAPATPATPTTKPAA